MTDCDVLVIGAGVAGLVAARELAGAGCSVRVVDKGRGVGGRLATRRIGAASCDHGAQFLSGRDPRFVTLLGEWRATGLLEPWGEAGTLGDVRWRVKPAMTAVAKRLAEDLDVTTGCLVTGIRRDGGAWRVDGEGCATIRCRSMLVTAPLPQALALLAANGLTAGAATTELQALAYAPCLVAMAVLDGESRVPAPGYVAPADGIVAWIADNRQKGVSSESAVTIHASAAFSQLHWDSPRQDSARQLVEAAAPWLGAPVRDLQSHGWRYARPLATLDRPFAVAHDAPLLLLAGDAFGGPDVEGAALSGWAAATALLSSR